jgi:hypothetical protein
MKLHSAVIALLLLMTMPSARTEETATMIGSKPMLTYEDVRKVTPALEAYTRNARAGRSKKSVPAMSSGFHPARSIGTARQRRPR